MLERQESGKSLREALEKELRRQGVDEFHEVRGIADALARITAAHPAEPAPDCPQTAEEEPHGPHQVATLEEGVWRDCPGFGAAGSRPLLNREAVSEALLAKWIVLSELKVEASPVEHSRALADSVMELARPMPTREQIDALLQEWRVGPAFRPPDADFPSALPNYRRKFRNALLTLLTGTES